MPRPLQVFLCHASQDKPEVWKLHRYLKTRGVKPWLDQADLLPGEHWETEIPKALFASDVILVCLSKNSVNKEGYVQKEIAFALDKALEKPEGTIFIIPIKLEDCELPRRLSPYHSVDLFRTDGRKRLLMSLNKRVKELGEEVLPIKIEDTKQRTPKPNKSEDVLIDQNSKNKAEENVETPILSGVEEQPEVQTLLSSRPSSFIEDIQRSKYPIVIPQNQEVLQEKYKPSTLPNPYSNEEKQEYLKPNINFRLLSISGIVFIGFLCVLLVGYYILNNFSIIANPIMTPTVLSGSTLIASTTPSSQNSTLLPSATSVPTLSIGSTIISEVDNMVLSYVPAGEFTMGSNQVSDEQPIHQVDLNAYWIDQTEITNEKYKLCVSAGSCNIPREVDHYLNSAYANHPVVYVSWEDARTYCEWAGRRLPSEAEWEKAARGTTGNLYPWGNNTPNNQLLNYNYNVGQTTDVGNYPLGKSTYGVFDMAGNVSEWVNDWYDKNYYQTSSTTNPTGPTSGQSKVIRGGAWSNRPEFVNSSNRDVYDTSVSIAALGFRCAIDADQ